MFTSKNINESPIYCKALKTSFPNELDLISHAKEGFKEYQIMNTVSIDNSPYKGRILFSNYDFQRGEIIFIEKPIYISYPANNQSVYNALTELKEEELLIPGIPYLYAAYEVMNNADQELKKLIFEKVSIKNPEISTTIRAVIKKLGFEFSPEKYQTLTSIMKLNCFANNDVKDSLKLYNIISFLSHSCDPSVFLTRSGNNFLLRARRAIKKGDELTVSYIGDDILEKCIIVRQSILSKNWNFICACERCSNIYDHTRNFNCSECNYGNFYLINKIEKSGKYTKTEATDCSYCRKKPDASLILQYQDIENQHINYLDNIKNIDIISIFLYIKSLEEIMRKHWIIHEYIKILLSSFEKHEASGDRDIHGIFGSDFRSRYEQLQHYLLWQNDYFRHISRIPSFSSAHNLELLGRTTIMTQDPCFFNHKNDISNLSMGIRYRASKYFHDAILQYITIYGHYEPRVVDLYYDYYSTLKI